MNRQRLTGLVLITLALIAVMSTSALRSRTVSGQAVVHPPPQVGDCWTSGIADLTFDNDVPAVDLQPCEGSRFGEVVAVDNKRSYTQQSCNGPALQYLGLPASVVQTNITDDQTETVWSSRAQVQTYTFGPDPLQVAAGQLWSACVVYGAEPGAQGLAPRPIPETVRSLATTGGAPFNQFATCTDSPIGDPAAACDGPHRYEIFLQAAALGANEPASLEACTTEIRSFTGMSDPTADGQLKPVLLPYTYDENTQKFQTSTYQQARISQGSVMCALTLTSAGQVLIGTLFGLYNQPLPIS